MNLTKVAFTCLVLTVASAPLLAADAVLEKAADLHTSGQSAAAFALLESNEHARAGDIQFDMLLGLVALDVGQNTRAVFALERVLAQDPKNLRARAEIGRAYLALGETQSARNEFETVKKLGVPGDVERTLDSFLNAVDRLEGEIKTTLRGYVEATFGYDTNVNVAPAKSEIAFPGLGGTTLTLEQNSRAVSDSFSMLGAGAFFRAPVNKQIALVGGVSGSQRFNSKREAFDILSADANIGAVVTQDKHIYSLTAQTSHTEIENDRYRDVRGFSGQWQYSIDSRNQVSAYGQYSNIRYVTQPTRDAERWTTGVGYAHATRDGHIGFVSAYWFDEAARREATLPHFSVDGIGLRFGGQYRLSGDMTAFGSLGSEWRLHKENDPAFLQKRSDQQTNLNLGVSYDLKRNLKLVGQYAWTNNRSNIELNQYRREVISVTIRHEF